VADVGEESCLAAVDFGKRLCPPTLGLQFPLDLLGSDSASDKFKSCWLDLSIVMMKTDSIIVPGRCGVHRHGHRGGHQ
jgi:hypothetical protein